MMEIIRLITPTPKYQTANNMSIQYSGSPQLQNFFE